MRVYPRIRENTRSSEDLASNEDHTGQNVERSLLFCGRQLMKVYNRPVL